MERESERVLLLEVKVEVVVVSMEPGLERNTCSSGIRDKDMNLCPPRGKKEGRKNPVE